jgi:hypothetical protein
MIRQRYIMASVLSLTLLAAGLWLLVAPGVQAQPSTAPLASGSSAVVTEYWKSGFTVEGSAAYAGVVGRLLSEAASFRSAVSNDSYFMFPAAASAKTVSNAKWMILQRSGAYTGTAQASLQVYSLNGVPQRTLTVSSLDLQTASIGTWDYFALSSTASDLALNPGEYLCVHFSLSGAAGGNLDVRPIFEISLR